MGPDLLARDPDSGEHHDEDGQVDAEFWSRRFDDPAPEEVPPRLEAPPRESQREPTRPSLGARDEGPDRPRADVATERREAELAELADARAKLQRVAVEFERTADARSKEAAERNEAKLAMLAEETKSELYRIAKRFERVATDRIAQVEELPVGVGAQSHEISEHLALLDRREAEFTRRVEEGLEHLDSQLAAWRNELTQHRRELDASLDSATKRLTELIDQVDMYHGASGIAIGQRVQAVEDALEDHRRAVERLPTAEFEDCAVRERDTFVRARVERTSGIHWRGN